MATIKEQVNQIMCYADTTEDKILALESSDYFRALKAVERIEAGFNTLESLGLMEDTRGCGGCEDALAECMGEEDDLPYVTPEDLFEFIKSVYALIEVERGGDEM